MIREGEFLWQGRAEFVSSSNINVFMQWLDDRYGLRFQNYEELRVWSVENMAVFWAAIWDYFEIISDAPFQEVMSGDGMPHTRWFTGSQVNYAEHILRHETSFESETVLYSSSEIRPSAQMRWRDLGNKVRIMASRLREMDIAPGDRVVSYMPNIPETAIAMLATTAIGAIWSSAAPEFGVNTVVDRFSQIEPKLVFAADGYSFNGTKYDRSGEIAQIIEKVPSLEIMVWLDYLNPGEQPQFQIDTCLSWESLMAGESVAREGFQYERVPHDHPLWILFSSGTTGLPKPIVHSHIGIIVEHYKMGAFHFNLKPSSKMFFYSTTGWMMWNTLFMGPMMGGAAVLYDGSPVYPDNALLWQLADEAGATFFGASPAYIELMRKHDVVPSSLCDLSSLDTVLLSGAPSTPETFSWFYENVKSDLWVTSQSGGTEFCSGVVGATPNMPVYAGEIQVRLLGVDVRVFNDEGVEIFDEVGEMVIVQPMPSMPLFMWGDDDFSLYHDAYFDTFPGIWRHGDFIKINDRGGCYIYGRSDSTLNRFGVRIGSSEIYRTMEGIEEVLDSLVICVETPDGGYYMPLFVTVRQGYALDDALIGKITSRLRRERSPRHVPDEIRAVPDIPYTLSGKKMEIPVRKLLMGWSPEKCFSRDAMKNPEAIDWYVDFAEQRARH